MSMSRPAFWILAVLAGGRRHGYQIMREAALSSEGLVTLKPTTLYAALERLERDGALQRDGEEIVDGRVRRYYRITEDGKRLLGAETTVLERSARAARANLGSAWGQAAPRLTGA
jgi:putative transcriptional regulator